MDFGGPFSAKLWIHSGRLKETTMFCWGIVGQTTKPMHIEYCLGVTMTLVLQILKNFVSRRGVPSLIYTDNKGCFVKSGILIQDNL
jgi:hypothetical protein